MKKHFPFVLRLMNEVRAEESINQMDLFSLFSHFNLYSTLKFSVGWDFNLYKINVLGRQTSLNAFSENLM